MKVHLSFMLAWLTKFTCFLMSSLIKRHQHFHLVSENNRAVSLKQIISSKDGYRAHDERQMWPLLHFCKLQTAKFSDLGLLSKKT